jgi:hypothetical protein
MDIRDNRAFTYSVIGRAIITAFCLADGLIIRLSRHSYNVSLHKRKENTLAMSDICENRGREYYVQKANELSSQLYPTIGEFILAFEAVCHELKMGIQIILEDNGLRNSTRLSNILIGDFTMSPLLNVYRSIIVETQKPNANELKIIDNIAKRLIELAEERNLVVHSAWFIDYKSPEDLEKGLLMQYRPGASKRGAKESPSRFPINNIKDFIKQARTLENLVEELNMCIYQGTKTENRFSVNKDGDVSNQGTFMDSLEKSSGQEARCVAIPRKKAYGLADSSTR